MRSLTVVSLQIKQLPVVIRGDVEDLLDTHPRSRVAQLRPSLECLATCGLRIPAQSCGEAKVD
jgi:hypothetical protein